MTPMRFHLARLTGNEPMLASLSVAQPALLADLNGARVALVGNARALADADHGAAIDAADLVVRINRAPMPSPASHGTRTDWLGLAVRLGAAERARLGAPRILWMSPRRKRLDWSSAHSPGFYLHPPADHVALAAALRAPPTTGLLLANLLLRSDLAALTLYGFDFFASLSLSGRRRARQLPHDFAAEAAWVDACAATDARLTLAA